MAAVAFQKDGGGFSMAIACELHIRTPIARLQIGKAVQRASFTMGAFPIA